MKIRTILKKIMISAGLVCMVSCTDLTEIENRLDTLESEVIKLNTVIETLNANVESLYYLKDGNVITDVEDTEEGWRLTLSNGKILELKNGAAGNSPSVSISEDGYWVINGVKQAVKAIGVDGEDGDDGTDGKTPQFSVDAEGYWTVSYDGGATASRVKDAEGNEIRAKVEITGGDSYFASVEVKDGCLVIKLRENGEIITVPIVKGFSFIIRKDGALVEGVRQIPAGSTVTFDVEQSGVAAAAIVACPSGFEAELTDTQLSVTSLPETKASASTSKDIAILAVSNSGISVMAKIQVEKTASEGPGEGGEDNPDTPAVPVAPGATLANSTHECYSFNSAKFNVTFTDASKLCYKVVPAADEAPDAVAVKEANVYKKPAEGDAVVNVSGLAPATDYKVYFVTSADGETYSTVGEFPFSTRAVNENNLYEIYAVGQDITAGGITVNKTNYPEATYICRGTTTRGTNKSGLTFVESHDEITANFDSGITNLIVVGTDPAKRANVKRTVVSYLSATDAEDALIMQNVKYVECTAHLFQFNKTEVFETVSFNNCELSVADGMRLMLSNAAANMMTEFSMIGCDLKLAGTSILIKMGGNIDKLTFDNNIIFSESELTAFNVISESSTIASVTFSNNTLYNTTINDAIFKAGTITTLNALNNFIVYANDGSKNAYIARAAFGSGEVNNNFYVRKADTSTPIYGVAGTKPEWVTHPAPKGAPAGMTDDWDPSAGKFILKGYTGVGATR